MTDKAKKKKDTILEEILHSSENVNQIGVEQARLLSKAESYEKDVASIWGVPESAETPDSKPANTDIKPSKSKESEDDSQNVSDKQSIEDSSMEDTTMEVTSMDVSSSIEETAIEERTMEHTSIEETAREEQPSIEDHSIHEHKSIEQNSIDDPSTLTIDWQIALYTLRNFPAFVRSQNELNPNEKIVLEHIFDRALLEGSHIVSITNSDLESHLNISYKWAGKTIQSLVHKNWIDHKLSLSKKKKSKASIEKALDHFIRAESLNIQTKALISQLFTGASMEEKSMDPYMYVLLVSKNIYKLTNEQNIEASIEESSIDDKSVREHLLYFSSYSSLKLILVFATLKGFDIQQMSKKFLFYLSEMFSDKTYGEKIPARAQKVEQAIIEAINYAAPKAKKNKWGYLEKALKDGWALNLTIDDQDKCQEESNTCSHLCEDPQKVSLFGVQDILDLVNAFPALTEGKEVSANNIDNVRKEIIEFFVFTPTIVEEFLAKNGFKSRRPSDELLG
ncbi:MAG TPA: hypothetical protein ENN47_01955 [Mesotoga infera]|uniref:Uncharacterized protein n=1 Tax=Mesotoga infera TaxID=1236046 RepID=A0A7C1CVD5_9BACT|nr:hypothetical protein [Mesotoga infera]